MQAKSAVDDTKEDYGWAEVAVSLAEEGGGLGLFVRAVVEKAKGRLDENEESYGDAEALVSGVELRVLAILDGIVDAKGEADHDADYGATLPDEVNPEGESDGKPDQECTKGEEDDETCAHEEAVGDGA